MAADVVSTLHVVLSLDGLRTETHVSDGQTTRLVSVEAEVGLSVEISVAHDQLDGLLGGTDRSVGTQTVENALLDVVREGVQRRRNGKRGIRHIIHHTQREVVLGLGLLHVVEDGLHEVGGELLASNTELSSQHADITIHVVHSAVHVEVKRLTVGVILTHLVQHADLLHGLGKGGSEVLQGEGSPQMHLHHSHLLALGVQVVHSFLSSRSRSSHHHDHVLGVLGTDIVEQVVLTTADLGDLVHGSLHLVGHSVVVRLMRLVGLHDSIISVEETQTVGVSGIQTTLTVLLSLCEGEDGLDLLGRNQLNRTHLVRSAETIEEVEEGNTALDARI